MDEHRVGDLNMEVLAVCNICCVSVRYLQILLKLNASHCCFSKHYTAHGRACTISGCLRYSGSLVSGELKPSQRHGLGCRMESGGWFVTMSLSEGRTVTYLLKSTVPFNSDSQ